MVNREIERKFLVRMPSEAVLSAAVDVTQIEQTYLAAKPGETERVRKRGRAGDWHFYHTIKRKITDISREEYEREITETEYRALLQRRDRERNTVYKTRYVLEYRGQSFELDVYPFWQEQAVLELELSDEEQAIDFPPELELLRELTHDKRYTNASLAKTIPEEDQKESV